MRSLRSPMARQEIYDAIVVGSGATGGWAAKELCEKGMRVIVLEAGRNLDPEKDFTEHMWPYEVRDRYTSTSRARQKVQSKCYACNAYGNQFFVDDVDNPYTTADLKRFDSRAPGRRANDHLGAPELSLIGLRIQSSKPRRLR